MKATWFMAMYRSVPTEPKNDAAQEAVGQSNHNQPDQTLTAERPPVAAPKRIRPRFSCWRCGERINTDHITPPIPTTDYDWRATFDDYDGAPDSHCPIGYGPTERAAVDDLLDQHQEDCSPSPEHVARTIAENEDDQKGCYG